MPPDRPPPPLPEPFAGWFARRGWQPHPHQLELLARAADPATLLIAPTGGGKTLAGFLPTLVELGARPPPGLHTLYVSPLKALAADIRRNLGAPLAEMDLAIRVEDRTGDTGAAARRRQRVDPPHILLTTPESLALMLSYEEAPRIFASVSRVIVDEIHALAESKRGDQLMLGLARLQTLAPNLRRVGLSATVEDPPALAAFLAEGARILLADPGPEPDISILQIAEPPPWAGQTSRYAARAVMDLIRAAKTTLVFINTRAQSELFFQSLWAENAEGLPIALHHGSLSRESRTRVEAAMVAGALRAIVATGSLDLGIDWGDVDLVIQVGAPKNVKRLVQRIGRANHRYNAPSRAVLVPANRFEVLECRAALDAVHAHDLDGEPRGPGPLDVLCQQILLTACAGPFDADALFAEVRTAGPYRRLARADFDACLAFCATGGYALRAYDRWQRLLFHGRPLAAARPAPRPRHPDERRHHRRHREARGAAPRPRHPARRDRGGLRRHPRPRRHLPDRRRDRALRRAARDDGRGHPPALAPAQDRRLRRHQARHLDPALAAGGRAPRPPGGLGRAAALHARLARDPARGQPPARARAAADRDLPARPGSRTSASTASPAATPTRPSVSSSPAAWRPPASTRSASSPTTTRC